MRIISQCGEINVPFEMSAIYRYGGVIFAYMGGEKGKEFVIAKYRTPEKAQKAMEMLKLASAKILVLNANAPDGLDEQLEELRTVISDIAKYTNYNGVEYFQFPKDEDVEV